MEENVIKFQAQIKKLETVADGGYYLKLSFGAQDMDAFIKLVQANQPGVLLEVAAVAVQQS